MIIFVSGAAGFIGFHLCKKLLEEGFKVIGFDNLNSYYDQNLKINRIVNQSSNREQGGLDDNNSNNESIVLEVSGKLYNFTLKDRLILHKESQDLGTYKKLSTYSKLLELLR